MIEGAVLALGMTVAVFAALWPLSLVWRDASVVDVWWGPGFLAQGVLAVWLAGGTGLRGGLALALIGLWSLRLGWVLTARRLRAGHEDPRYGALRAAWGPGFWWKSLGVVFGMQALVQWVLALGPTAAVVAAGDPGALAWIGAALALAGLGLEARADAELDHFKRHAGPGALCDTGLRARMRHPNYTGEIGFWTGIALIGIDGGVWGAAVTPVLLALLLWRVSGAPMLDDHLGATRPGYAAYRARVPGFIPWRLSARP